MVNRSWLASSLVALTLSGCAATYESAEQSYQDGDFAEARDGWTQLALEGDSRSMYRLYTTTNRPSVDEINWLKMAADSGLAAAQYDYGMYLLTEEKYKDAQSYLVLASDNAFDKATQVLKENQQLFPLWVKTEEGDLSATNKLGEFYWNKNEYKQALKWFERCAQKDNDCSFYMGLANANGHGIEKSDRDAIKWYSMSAKAGNTSSARNLAWLYEDGRGTRIDLEQAFYWMSKAEQGSWIATSELGRYYLYGIGTEKNPQKAFTILENASSHSKYASYNLAKMYYFGDGIDKNYDQSYKYFLAASKQQHAWSDYYIGHHYYHGYGKEKNYTYAFNWFEKAANDGVVDAQFRLGWMLSEGEGVTKNSRKAFRWYEKAAEQGSLAAQNNLGVMYANGDGTEKDDFQAFKWYEKAAKQGDDVAQNNLGVRYQYGQGVRKSNQLAAYWYAKSSQQNYKSAQSNLSSILEKLGTKSVNVKLTSLYEDSNFDSEALISLSKGERVYVLSNGSKWTEVYVPKNHTIGYVNNTHLY